MFIFCVDCMVHASQVHVLNKIIIRHFQECCVVEFQGKSVLWLGTENEIVLTFSTLPCYSARNNEPCVCEHNYLHKTGKMGSASRYQAFIAILQ